ncbi:sarcosine oxidase subunit alpha [Labrys miyagiensis]
MPEVRIMRRTQVFGAYDGGTFGALERVSDHLPLPSGHQPRQRLWHIMARRCVNAMGAVERPIVFGGNDRPGVMLASAVRTYLNRYGVAPGRQAAIFTTGDDGWRTAADLTAAGVTVAAIVDSRQEVSPDVSSWASSIGTRMMLGARVTDAKGGAQGIKAVEVISGRSRETIAADLLAVSGGWNPQVALTTHKGNKPRWSDDLAAFVPGDLPEGMTVAGAANGDFSLGACLRAGFEAGRTAATDCGFSVGGASLPTCKDEAVGLTPLWHVAESHSKAFVDQQNDVTAKDIEIAHREGFRSVEHLKRYTTLGMATDQGKTSGVAGHAMMAALVGRPMTDVGTTAARPPHLPVAIGALAGPHRGKHFKATRLTAGHDWSIANGATMVEAGQWLRPQWFTRPGEKDWLESVSREVRTTRSAVGVCDVSTLGKIDIKGADAGAFLDRVYVNTFSTVAVGKARYGLMLREDGFVMDDGTSARFALDHFVMSTTTANAVKVMQHLEFCRQVLWPELDVSLSSITEQWSQYSVAGPKARELLQKLYGPGTDLSDEAFPYMGCGLLALGNVSSRLYRLSFSGELAYEIAVPAQYGLALLEALMALAMELGGCAYGTEALGVMRVEKGHVAGNELSGQTTVRDLGLGKMMSTKKDYIGRILAGRPALTAADRPALVGLKPVNPAERLRAGAHFLKKGAAAEAGNDEGYVTSVVYSPMVESWIGLGLLAGGPARHGEVVRAYDPVRNGDIEVEIVSPVFFDPEGSRLHV